MEDPKAFLNNPKLGNAMKTAGVLEAPHVIYFNEVAKGSL
jgi:hypothetical protein